MSGYEKSPALVRALDVLDDALDSAPAVLVIRVEDGFHVEGFGGLVTLDQCFELLQDVADAIQEEPG